MNGADSSADALADPPARNPKQFASTVRPLLIGRQSAAEALGLSVASWDRAVAAGKTPAPLRLGGRLLFRWSDLEAWVGLGCPDRKTFEALTVPPPMTNGRPR